MLIWGVCKAHSNDGHAENPEVEAQENDVLAFGILETMISSV